MNKEFYDAAVFGYLEKLNKMLNDNRNIINSSDEYGFTALHGAVGEDNCEIVLYLIDNGANVNAQNDSGIAPLHLCAYPDSAKILIQHGADLEILSKENNTPLIVLSSEPESDDVIEELLKNGVDVMAKNKYGETALNIAVSRKDKNKIQLLKKYGAK